MNANSQFSLVYYINLTLFEERREVPYCEDVSSQGHKGWERILGHAAVRPGHVGLPSGLVGSGAGVSSQPP